MQSLLSLWSKTELGTTSVEEVESFYRQYISIEFLKILFQNIIKLISMNKMTPK